jgi:hypothetical protein
MRDFDVRTGRINVDMLYFPKEGRPKRHWHSIRLYTFSELEALMGKAGLRVTQTWGNYDGSAFRLQSPRMMVMATKGA